MYNFFQSMETTPQKYGWVVSTVKCTFKVLGNVDLDA